LAVKVTWAKAPSCTERETPCKTRLRVTAANTGKAAVKITEMGIRYPKKNRVEFETLERLDMVLGPSEEGVAYFEFQHMKDLPRYDTIFVKDDTGAVYYPDSSFAARIGRFLWWRFGSCPIKE
jgi:hypothetical protein